MFAVNKKKERTGDINHLQWVQFSKKYAKKKSSHTQNISKSITDFMYNGDFELIFPCQNSKHYANSQFFFLTHRNTL